LRAFFLSTQFSQLISLNSFTLKSIPALGSDIMRVATLGFEFGTLIGIGNIADDTDLFIEG
jgi:hypothetical protein